MSTPTFWQRLLSRRMLACIGTGFASGLPLYTLTQLVPAWLRDEGVDLATIGLFALTGLPYTWKFVWAPLLDALDPLGLGRRRTWSLLTQLALLVGIASFGWLHPGHDVTAIGVLAVAVAFFSATQDIALDAWRREILPDAELGLGNAFFVNAYRVASLVPGGVSLALADQVSWTVVWMVTAAFMALGLVTTALAPAPAEVAPPRTFHDAVLAPFGEFFGRDDLSRVVGLLAFLLLYKLGDSLATALITPFYLDVGFSKTVIGTVAKGVGLTSTIVGAFVGGAVMTRIGIHKALWIFGVVQLLSILGFAVLAEAGPVVGVLAAAVAFEYLGIGLGTAAFVAFLQAKTDQRFTATQFALLSSFVALPRTVVNASAGVLAETLGWTGFFLLCTALAVPGLILLPWVAPWRAPSGTSG